METDKYRIDRQTGSVYRWSQAHNAYLFFTKIETRGRTDAAIVRQLEKEDGGGQS